MSTAVDGNRSKDQLTAEEGIWTTFSELIREGFFRPESV